MKIASRSLVRRQRGSLLLEALIGILIFSFGVLGLVGLQARSMKHLGDAQYRAEAVYLAHSLIARMWADNQASLAASYETGTGAGYTAFKTMAQSLPHDAVTPDPVVHVEAGPSVNSSLVTVTLYWNVPGGEDSAGTNTPTIHNYMTQAVIGLN